MPLNHDRPFLAVNIALLTVSDTRSFDDDRSGNTLQERAEEAGHKIVARKIVRDEFADIVAQLQARGSLRPGDRRGDLDRRHRASPAATLTPRRSTACLSRRRSPGSASCFRWQELREDLHLDDPEPRHRRAVAGGTYLFALPGSPGACRDAWDGILVHQLDNRFRPCNFVELMPRLTEK